MCQQNNHKHHRRRRVKRNELIKPKTTCLTKMPIPPGNPKRSQLIASSESHGYDNENGRHYDIQSVHSFNLTTKNKPYDEQDFKMTCSRHYRRGAAQIVHLFSHAAILTFAIFASTNNIQQATGQQSIQAPSYGFLLPGYNLENLRIPESTPVGTIVHTLRVFDGQNKNRGFTFDMTGDTFSVNETSGEVKLIKPLDREKTPQISTAVLVFESNSRGDPIEIKRRNIIIEDVDDSWPIFKSNKFSVINDNITGQYFYQVSINENSSIGTIIMNDLQIVDLDEGPNAEVVLECRPKQSTSSACDVFALELRKSGNGRYTMTVKTKAFLDYERIQAYKLTLVARGKRASPIRGEPLESEAVINIDIVNSQDEGPVFVNAPYSLSMLEGLRNGTRLLNVIVQDGDAHPQNDLTMIVVPGPFSEYFQVVKDPVMSKVWYLETNATLDRESPQIRESGNMFTIELLAAELNHEGQPVASENELLNALREPNYSRGTLKRENVTVLVLDMPDSKPIFVQASTGRPLSTASIIVNVSESILAGTSVPNLDLAVYDLDQGVNSRFNLSLVDAKSGPPASRAFALESEMIYGKAEIVIRVLNSTLIDYEVPTLRSYKFHLVASKSFDSQLIQKLEVQFNILDANDNSPVFERDQYLIEIPEATQPGTLIATIKAVDLDSGRFGKIDYTMRGIGASKFNLISNEGKIIVNDCGLFQCLDYEAQPSYSLTYEARDGGGRTKNVSVLINIIDINDHTPKFTEQVYKRELISDSLSSKQNYISPQLIVRARDEDGPTQGRNNITYMMKSTNLTGLDVDPTLGLVYLSQPIDLDNMVSKITNNNNMRVGDRKIVFEAEVIAQDNGTPPLNSSAKILLTVRGDRDGAPQFKQDIYQVFVRENQPVGKPFFQVQAIDPDDKDSHLRYTLGYDLNDLVSINIVSGELSFKSTVDYDEFQDAPYNITVYATDNSKPYPLKASAQISIFIQDVNDKPPKFEEKEYKAILVQGRTKKGDSILQVRATDPDRSSSLNYSINEGDIDVYDRNGQLFTLDDLANSTIGYLSQMGKIERRNLVASIATAFEIDKRNGTIRLKSEPDYTFASSIILRLQVRDLNEEVISTNGEHQSDFATCTFFLQTYFDRSPAFAPPWSVDRPEYTIGVLEEQGVGNPVFSLLARDVVTNNRIDIFEKVFESDPKDYFRVEKDGVVLINRRIDYEELPSPKKLSFSVKALTNEGSFSIAKIIVNVIDLNDNAPQFKNSSYSVSISEAINPSQEILTVSAEDHDSSNFGRIYYSLSGYSSDYFAIDSRKGVIRIKNGVKLDRDTEPFHSLLVTASDCNETRTAQNYIGLQLQDGEKSEASGCKKSSVFVNVTVLDENDNDPVFINVNKLNEFEALIPETVSAGTVVAQAKAFDLDEGANGHVGYEIVQGDDAISRLLKIDQDGFITLAEAPSGMGRANPYRLTIRAFDHGKSSRQNFATLLLTVSDVVSNDGVPKFIRPRPDEIISLSENSGPSTFVYQVKAIDPDEETDGKLMYKFIHPSDVFDIDPFTGVIKTQNRLNLFLDRELVPNYTLIVAAQDLGSPPKQVQLVLTIHITDINDNEPYFDRGIYDPPIFMFVEEEVPKDTLIGSIRAIDKDTGQNGLIGYEIIEGNHNNMFRLNFETDEIREAASNDESQGNSCKIYSNGRLDRETRDNYTLTIKASSISKFRNTFINQLKDPLGSRNPFNQYNESDFSKIRITVKLLDINDNRPVFSQQNAKSIIDSTAETYSQLMVFKAIDADSSNQEVQYSVLDALYFSDSKLRRDDYIDTVQSAGVRMRHVFVIDPLTGILRNAVSLRPYTDGYFELYIKADSGFDGRSVLAQNSAVNERYGLGLQRKMNDTISKCDTDMSTFKNTIPDSNGKQQRTRAPFAEVEDCNVAVTRATVFVTHQRETFRFVFNKTKLNDRYDEFKNRIQTALEELMFEPAQVLATTDGHGMAKEVLPKADKIYLNTFNTDFYEREDGSLDFSTLTSCSQLVKFDDRSEIEGSKYSLAAPGAPNQIVPNQVVNYEEVVNLLKTLNATQMRQQKTSIFSQYGLVNIEKCLSDKTTYRMTLAERVSIYFASMIALIGALLALIVSRMRKSYEKNLKLLQRSKYQYMGPYATLPPAMASPSHHASVNSLQGSTFAPLNYNAAPHLEGRDGPTFESWQL